MAREYTPIPFDYLEIMEELTDEEFGELIRGLLKYTIDGTEIICKGRGNFYRKLVMKKEDYYLEAFNKEEEAKKKRSEHAKKAADARYGNTPDMLEDSQEDYNNTYYDSTVHDMTVQTKPNQTKPIIMKSLRSSCSELCESSEPKDAPVVKIPLRDHSEYPIYQDDIDRWQEFYKRIDVKLELLRMIEWFDANPSRKKTDRGIRLAANNWLIRANDREAPAANTEPCYKSNAEKMTAENPSWREEWLKDTDRAC